MTIDVLMLTNDEKLVAEATRNTQKFFGVAPTVLYNAKSIATGYNELARNSKADILCFLHQDTRVKFSSDVLIRYFKELDKPGVVGFCGSKNQIPGKQWHECPPTYGGLAQGKDKPIPLNFLPTTKTFSTPEYVYGYEEVQTLDGYCLFMLRSTYESIGGFDEAYAGWHGYDIDICFKAMSKGFKNYVIRQPSQHYSWGGSGPELDAALLRFKEKWKMPDKPKGRLKLCVYTICRDELQFVERFTKSCADADGIYVLDTGSVDGTPEALRKLGVNVEVCKFDKWKTLEEYDQLKADGKNPWRFDVSRNMSIDMLPNDCDVAVCIDMDEILTPGWRKIIEDQWVNGVNHLSYLFAWSMVDGKPRHCFWYEKIHSRNGYLWASPVHEALVSAFNFADVRAGVQHVLVEHYPDSSKSRAQYLPLLELGVRETPHDTRIRFYLGREYTFAGRYQDAINSHTHYLKMPEANCARERSNACIQIAQCYGNLKNEKQQFNWLLKAITEESTQRETWVELAEHCRIKGDNLLGYWATQKALSIPKSACDNNYLVDPDAWSYKPYDLASVMGWYAGNPFYKEESMQNAWMALKHSPFDSRLEANYRLIQASLAKPATATEVLVDVVILSYSKTEAHYDMCKQTIQALRVSSPDIGMRFVVVETNKNLAKESFTQKDKGKLFGVDVEVCYPNGEFGFNAYLKAGYDHLGELQSKAKYVALINNDITLFSYNFMGHMVEGMKSVSSASPLGLREATWGLINESVAIDENYDVNKSVNGWFLMIDKRIFNLQPFEYWFPPMFKWYSGDVYYAQMLEKCGYRHGLIVAAQALHLQQQSSVLRASAGDRTEMLLKIGIKGKRCAEIGVDKGAFAKDILSQDPSSLLLVDPWQHQDDALYPDPNNVDNLEYEKIYQDVQKLFGGDSRVTLCRSLSVKAAELNLPDSLDFVYIDANHEEPFVYEDMCCWWPKVKKGGWLCGHDFQYKGVCEAVQRFCRENKLEIAFVTQEPVPSWAIHKNV